MVTYLKEEIKQNRETHREIFESALEGYRKRVVDRLNEMLDRVKQGKDIEHVIDLPHPVDHTSDYDTVLTMLENCENEVVELGQREFAQYVLDKWDWTHNFLATNTIYTDKL